MSIKRAIKELLRPILSPVVSPLKSWGSRIVLAHQTKKYLQELGDSTNPIVDSRSLVDISLTSHGDRIKLVHLTIGSISRGNFLPRKITLWLNDPDVVDNPSEALRRLVKRGLEIKLATNYGPHTKYFPEVLASDLIVPLVTADDDIIYPKTWLSDLVLAHRINPSFIVCHRAHRVSLINGKLTPYRNWEPCTGTMGSILNFATGVSGVLYPVEFLLALKKRGNVFMLCCPKGDDLWLHATAVRENVLVSQIKKTSKLFPMSINHHIAALSHENVANSANDVQIKKTYTPAELEKLDLEFAKDKRA